jgi:hypothetical protein
MEIKTKYNVGDKVWIMRNNKPEKIQISNIEVEVILVCKCVYLYQDKTPICKHNECNCFNTKKDLLYSFLDDSDYGKEETDINAELPL